jgi:hypothetical protein
MRRFEELIDWVAREVKTVSDTVWQLNDNFVVLVIEGVLSMLNGAGCEEVSNLCRLAASNNASVSQNIPNDVRRLVGQLVRRWWKNHGLLEALRRGCQRRSHK